MPPRKHIHFTSTPLKPADINLFDADDDHTIIDHLPPNAPETDANSLITNTFTAVASEFKKMHEPKIQKLKGGTSSSAPLFSNSWVKDVRLTIEERAMNNTKSLQLVKDFTEGKAKSQVEFYLASTPFPTFEGLIKNLTTSFQSSEDEATLKGEFYSCRQLSKESIDDFPDALQVLARKVLNVDESFQKVMNKSLNAQLANGLKDPNHTISARAIMKQDPNIAFAEFRADLATILGCRGHVSGKGVSSSAVLDDSSPETPVPAKRRKKDRENEDIAAQLSMCLQDSCKLHKKIDAFDPSKITEVVAQAVTSNANQGYNKPNYNKPLPQKQAHSGNPFGKPYLGPPRPSQVTPGADGNLDPAKSCNYCKDTGHDKSNCTKLQQKEAAMKAAGAPPFKPNFKSNQSNQGK